MIGGKPSHGLEALEGLEIGPDVWVGPNAVIMLGVNGPTKIGARSMIGGLCNIGHDSEIGEDTKILNGTIIAGHVKIGPRSWVGIGCRFRERVSVGEGSLIGMGSNVVEPIPANVIAWGNPCRVIKRREHPMKYYFRRLKRWMKR